jgi:hypothetical protein
MISTVERFATHEVMNQPSTLENYNAFADDKPLNKAVRAVGADAFVIVEEYPEKTVVASNHHVGVTTPFRTAEQHSRGH